MTLLIYPSMNLKVSLIQTDLVWQNANTNRSHIEELIWDIEEEVNLIILPEMFSTSFSFSRDLAEPHNLHTFKWMLQMASLKQAAIIGSFLISEKGSFYNRCYCVQPDGTFQTYDKRHLFSLSKEKEFCTPGVSNPIFNVKGWKIKPSICYDLRFPVWLRNHEKYDLLINIANWPSTRKDTWQTLLQARAIENQCFSIGVNRLGKDGNQLDYKGESAVYTAEGSLINNLSQNNEIITTVLEQESLKETRQLFPFLQDQDKFTFN